MSKTAPDHLATLDALGLLPSQDAAAYRRLLAETDEELLRLHEAFGEAAARLALSIDPVAPPPTVKQRVMDAIRPRPVKAPIRTVRAAEGQWIPQREGVEVRTLSFDRQRSMATIMMRVAAGASIPTHEHTGAEECYVISGTVRIGELLLEAGDFHHADAGSHHAELTSDMGCTLLLVVDGRDYC